MIVSNAIEVDLRCTIFAGRKGFLRDGCPGHLWAELSSARRNPLRASLRQIGRAMLAVSLIPGGVWMPEIRALRKDPHFQTFAQRMRVIVRWKPCGLPDKCDLYGDGVACR